MRSENKNKAKAGFLALLGDRLDDVAWELAAEWNPDIEARRFSRPRLVPVPVLSSSRPRYVRSAVHA